MPELHDILILFSCDFILSLPYFLQERKPLLLLFHDKRVNVVTVYLSRQSQAATVLAQTFRE